MKQFKIHADTSISPRGLIWRYFSSGKTPAGTSISHRSLQMEVLSPRKTAFQYLQIGPQPSFGGIRPGPVMACRRYISARGLSSNVMKCGLPCTARADAGLLHQARGVSCRARPDSRQAPRAPGSASGVHRPASSEKTFFKAVTYSRVIFHICSRFSYTEENNLTITPLSRFIVKLMMPI